MKQQSGFTLIELIAVIVILGIIAAVAVPRFVDLSAAAESASVRGIAGTLSSAHSLNYAASVASKANLDGAPEPVAVDNCNVVNLLEGGLPDNFAIEDQGIAEGETAQCNVSIADSDGDYDASNPTASFTGFGVAI